MTNAASFCDLFCKAYCCSPQEFDERLFWHCLYPHAVGLARLLWRLNRAYFEPDLELVRQVKFLTRADEVVLEIEGFRLHRRAGLLRGLLKVRISGRRLLDTANRIFAEAA